MPPPPFSSRGASPIRQEAFTPLLHEPEGGELCYGNSTQEIKMDEETWYVWLVVASRKYRMVFHLEAKQKAGTDRPSGY